MPETESLVINTGPLLALIAGYEDLSLLEKIYKRVLVPFEVCLEMEAGGSVAFGINEFKKSTFLEKQAKSLTIFDGAVKSRFSDGAVKSSRSRLARFRRMQSTYPYVKF